MTVSPQMVSRTIRLRFETKHHQFVDNMAPGMTWRRELAERQGIYLLSVFRQLAGR